MWRRLLEVADDAFVRPVLVHQRSFEVLGEQVTRDAKRQFGLLVEQRRRLRLLGARVDRLPELLEEEEVALDVLRRRTLRSCANDHTAAFEIECLEHVLEASAFLVVEAARDAEPVAVRLVDDEAAGQRDLRRQPRAFRLHRILDGLDHDRLAATDQVLDLLAVPRLAFELGRDDLVHVEKAVLLEADLDERGLHPRQDVVDRPQIDIAGDRPALGALEIHLRDPIVLQDGNPLLADVDGHEKLPLRLRKRCPTRRLATATLLRAFALTPLRGRLPVGPRRPRRRLRLRLCGLALCLGRRRCLLRAAAPAAATATTSRPGAARLSRFVGGLGAYRFRCFWSGSLAGRLLLGLSRSKPAQEKSPSCARAAATPSRTAARSVRGRLWVMENICSQGTNRPCWACCPVQDLGFPP